MQENSFSIEKQNIMFYGFSEKDADKIIETANQIGMNSIDLARYIAPKNIFDNYKDEQIINAWNKKHHK